jgi:copper chaperone CopZ
MRYSIFVLFAVGSIFGCSDKDLQLPETTATTFNSAGAPTVEFSVPDMMCPDSCAVKTKEILAEQPGAKDVYVDFEAKTATVVVEDGEFDAEQALAALVDHGFDQSTLKDDAAAKPQAAEEAGIQ